MHIRPAAIVLTKDLAGVVRFLREVLGFAGEADTFAADGTPGRWVLRKDGIEFTVVYAVNACTGLPPAQFVFLVPDLEPIAAKLRELGIVFMWEGNTGARGGVDFLAESELRMFRVEEEKVSG